MLRVILAAAAMLMASRVQAAEPAPAPDETVRPYLSPQRLVDVGRGRRLNLVCMGQGAPTVVFDAGGSDWSAVWALVQPVIAKETTACAYDRGGLGYSDPAPGPRRPVAIVEDLHALRKASGLPGPLVLVGHSLGGFNVKLYAALHPEDVAGLVLVDPSEDRTWERTRGAMRKRYGSTTAARAELLDQQFIGRLVEHFRDCAAAARDQGLDPASVMYRRCTDPVWPALGAQIAESRVKVQKTAAYQAAQAAEIAGSVYGEAAADPVYRDLFRPGLLADRPVVVLTHQEPASDDPVDRLSTDQGLALHRETARLSRRGVHRVVPNSGHYIELDAPDVVIGAIREVVESVRKGQA